MRRYWARESMGLEDKIVNVFVSKRDMIAELETCRFCTQEGKDNDTLTRGELIQKRLRMIKVWFSFLNRDQKFVIEHHLVQGMSWQDVVAAYAAEWPKAAKAERTLIRKQAEALVKISEFIKTNHESIGFLLEDLPAQD